jgi:hypothetical protein
MRYLLINKKLLIGIIIGALFLYLGFRINKAANDMHATMSEYLPQTFILPKEDSTIFSKEAREKTKVLIVYNHKFRKPISFLSFDNKYSIILFQTNYIDNPSPVKVTLKKKGNLDRTVGVIYNVIPGDGFTFQHKAGKLIAANKIILSFDGELASQSNNMEGTNFFGCIESLAMKYEEDEPQDIFIASNNRKKCWEILFINKMNKIYCLLASPNDSKQVLKPDFLYSLISTADNN